LSEFTNINSWCPRPAPSSLSSS